MNKKKIIYIISFLMTTIIVISNANQAIASGVGGINPSTTQVSSFGKAIKVTIGIFQVVTVGLGAIMLIVLAVKYMSAAPGEKAEIKKHAVIYIVGAIIAFSASAIAQIIKKFATDIGKKI